MPVPAAITDLSTTPSSNSPAGTETPTLGDDNVRTLSAFIASLRDKLNGTTATGVLKDVIFSGTTAKGVSAVAYKTATTTISGSTVLTDDPHLTVPLEGGAFAIELWIPVWATTGGTGGFKHQMVFTGTATSSVLSEAYIVNSVSSSVLTFALSAIPVVLSTISVSASILNADWIKVTGHIVVSVAGNLKLQWAQNTANNAANVGVGGWLICTKVS